MRNDEERRVVNLRRKCKHCQSIVGELYRMNGDGAVFCDDDCYDEYTSENEDAPDDHCQPYIDDYDAIRFEYLEFLKFEEEIMSPRNGQIFQYNVDEILDSIDSVQWEFFDYYHREGDDGVFAHEIYSYYLKLEKLKEKILRWKPEREVFFYLKIRFKRHAFPNVINNWFDFAELLQQIGLKKLYQSLKENVFREEEMAFYFFNDKKFNNVLKELRQYFNEDQIQLYMSEAYRCHGCGEVKSVKARNTKRKGWFFCDSCAKPYDPGFFTKKELLNEIKLCDQDDDFLKRSELPNWHYYIRKIKRSCRYHHIDYPDWIELAYDR